MQSEVPKQFLELNGRPVLMHTISVFREADPDIRIILVLPPDQFGYWEILCKNHQFRVDYELVAGGPTRFDSVKNGLQQAPDTGWIGVHDGVRPFIPPETIRSIFAAARTYGNAVPAIVPAESVRIASGSSNHPVDRDTVRLIQTPQVFEAAALKQAYQRSYDPAFTDDASVFEAAGHPIHLTEGHPANLKITVPSDLPPE